MFNVNGFDGATLLGSGSRRNVYLYDETSVLKVDTEDHNNYISTRGEVYVWNQVKDTEDARFFAAILEYTDDGWIRMERVKNIGDYTAYSSEFFTELCEVAAKYEVSDMHSGNIGQRADGSWCIIDYGGHMPTYNARNVDVSDNDPDRPCSCWECQNEEEEESYESPTCYLSCCNVRDESGLISLPF